MSAGATLALVVLASALGALSCASHDGCSNIVGCTSRFYVDFAPALYVGDGGPSKEEVDVEYDGQTRVCPVIQRSPAPCGDEVVQVSTSRVALYVTAKEVTVTIKRNGQSSDLRCPIRSTKLPRTSSAANVPTPTLVQARR